MPPRQMYERQCERREGRMVCAPDADKASAVQLENDWMAQQVARYAVSTPAPLSGTPFVAAREDSHQESRIAAARIVRRCVTAVR